MTIITTKMRILDRVHQCIITIIIIIIIIIIYVHDKKDCQGIIRSWKEFLKREIFKLWSCPTWIQEAHEFLVCIWLSSKLECSTRPFYSEDHTQIKTHAQLIKKKYLALSAFLYNLLTFLLRSGTRSYEWSTQWNSNSLMKVC